jgi:nucleoside-diphosphate kinase
MNDLFIGSIITVYSRQLKVVDYGDVYTRKYFEVMRSSTCALIKPDAYTHIGKILDMIVNNNFSISRMKMFKWTPEQAQGFYDKGVSKEVIQFMSSDVVVGLELVGDGAVEKWQELIGPANSAAAKSTAPKTIRALFGTDNIKNAVHGSASTFIAAKELDYIFGEGTESSTTALLSNCSCLIIKPHAIKAGNAGKIIDMVLEEGFEISALELYKLNKTTAEEFFDVYKDVLPEYNPIVEHIITGPVIVMEVRQENVVQALRNLVGPNDPEIAKHLRPNTIR